MAQQISIAFHLLVLASVASGRGHHYDNHAMIISSMPFPDTTGISIALPPTAGSPAPQQEPPDLAMAPQVNNILRSPSPAPSPAGKADEGSVFASIVNSLGSPQDSPAQDLIGKALDALAPIAGPAKDELEKQGAKMAADHILESLAPESSDGAIKDVLDKVGGIGGASDAITNVISSSGTDVNDLISKALETDSPSVTSDDAAKTTTTSDLEKIIAAAAAASASKGGSDEKQEGTNGGLSMRSSSAACTFTIVAVTACFMF